jgi:hypothetical protein
MSALLVRVTEVVAVLPFREAVIVTVRVVLNEPVLAAKLAVVAPAATVTEVGTVSEVLLLPRVSLDPPAGAGWVVVTVQVPVALWPRVVGVQIMPETRTGTGASRLTVADCELVAAVAALNVAMPA